MYTCKNSFTAENTGNFYRKDQNISLSEYEDLTYDEQMNFFRNYNTGSDNRETRSDGLIDDVIGFGIGAGIASMLSDDSPSTDFGSSSSDSDFGGMGGGDFGGGGASSDF